MKFRILFGAAIMVASLAVATGLVGTTSIASAAPPARRTRAQVVISPRRTSPASPRGTTPASRLRVCATYSPMP